MSKRSIFVTAAVALVAIVLAGLGVADAGKRSKKPRRIEVTVTEDGFTPEKIAVKKGEPVLFVFTRKTDRTCAKEVIIYLGDDQKIEKKLPLDQPVEIAATFARSGELGYSCAMGHIAGVIQVE